MRIEKTFIVDELKARYDKSALMVLTSYHGLSADDLNDLRARIAASQGTLNVVKNRLLKRVLADATADEFGDLLSGPNAVAATDEDVVSLAKALKDYSKQHDVLEIRGGLLDMSTLLTPEDINALASLPSREVLLGQLIGSMQGPVRGLVTVFNALLSGMVRALDEIAKLKAEAGDAVAEPAEEGPAEAAAPAEEAAATPAEAPQEDTEPPAAEVQAETPAEEGAAATDEAEERTES
jgi:large subunit ribosomal protein L10